MTATLTTAQAATRLKVTPCRVGVFCRAGRIKATLDGTGNRATWRIDAEDLERFAAEPRPTGIRRG